MAGLKCQIVLSIVELMWGRGKTISGTYQMDKNAYFLYINNIRYILN